MTELWIKDGSNYDAEKSREEFYTEKRWEERNKETVFGVKEKKQETGIKYLLKMLKQMNSVKPS